MSIREIGEKIKIWFADDRRFFAVLLVGVSLLSFGAGRLSVIPMPQAPKPAVVVQKAANDASKEIGTSTEANTGDRTSAVSAATNVSNTAAAAAATGNYVASKKGEKYHSPDCPGAKTISEENKIWFATKEEAEKAGYTPAKNCPGL